MPNHQDLIEILLQNRGIKRENWDKFLNPSYENDLSDPFLLKDMEKAVVRIFEAIEANEKIVIFSDYDSDGIPASVIMHDFFKKIGFENFSVYIPDRYDEGYGLYPEIIDTFIKDKVGLLITFDLGITAVSEVAQAEASGMNVIITDHHLPVTSIPHAYAIIDPKVDRGDNIKKNKKANEEENIFNDFCGAGIAFKLVQALIKKYGDYWKINNGWEKWLLDMAGLATIADQVPLLDENRVLAFYGLKVLQKGRRLGLSELLKKASVDVTKINEEDISFTLAPRINAASRMASPMLAFEILSTTDSVRAKNLADELSKINDDRKYLVSNIMKEANKILKKRELNEIIVVGNPKWKVGVLGIVASKIVEEYKKTVFVWGEEGGCLKGSCRSLGDINLVEAMSSLPENSLIEFGGHKMAGGFSVSHQEIHFLEERILRVYKEKVLALEKEKAKAELTIDLDDVTEENNRAIEKLAPFGMANPRPKFFFKNVEIFSAKEFGKEKNHLELSFKNSRGRQVKAISFFKTTDSFNKKLETGVKIDLIATFEKNNFAGRSELRLRIIDIL
jgi:single-stranded-DNA-specific exonuclease